MRKIPIDDEVYALLEDNVRGFEQPNDVLRRLLLGSNRARPPRRGPAGGGTRSPRGKLAPLIASGTIKAGDTLTHAQVRKGQIWTSAVEPDGRIRTDQGRYDSPSPALGDLTNTSVDGWRNWTHDRSGKTLHQLRQEAGTT
jgi:hypothetical protein